MIETETDDKVGDNPTDGMDNISKQTKMEGSEILEEDTTKEERQQLTFLSSLWEKIEWVFSKNSEKKGLPGIEAGLKDLCNAKIITEAEKEKILVEFNDPEVREAIKTRTIGQIASIGYLCLNTVLTTPTVTTLCGPGYGLLIFGTLYFIKRLFMSGVIYSAGKNLKNRKSISRKTATPLFGAHMTLIDLCKTHPLVAEYFYALEMTKGAHRKFNNAKDIEGKDRASKERQEAINKKIAKFRKWVTKDSHTKH